MSAATSVKITLANPTKIINTPRLLDLFCGEGGAGMGYALAGFEVIGIDVVPQPRYPFQFVRADALDVPLDGFDLIHASPPCQEYSVAHGLSNGRHPRLVEPVRERLWASSTPYVIENVPGAPLINPTILCGTMFGLKVYRHRLFETSFPVTAPQHVPHVARCAPEHLPPQPGEFVTVYGAKGEHAANAAAMGTWWMTRAGLSQSIPPAYTYYLGRAFATQAGYDLPINVALTLLPTADDLRRRERRRRRRRDALRTAARDPGSITALVERYQHVASELARARTALAAYEVTP
jgi:DNA (cytosine-5)-methyltransferase 1